MPYIPVAIAFTVGFFSAKGSDSVGSIVKWGVLGGGMYIGAKAFKVI